MNNYIGIDLGTSGAKILLVSASGKILAENTQRYPVNYPGPGMSEQNPADWLRAAKEGVKAVLDGKDASCVKGISFGGQMHGSVLLDKYGNVIRPAILWNDGRTGEETDYLNNVVGKDTLRRLTGNIAFAGFTVPKLLWLKKHEPDNFAKATKIMLPKDYLAYKFSGEFCTDLSDASGTLLLDVERRDWSDKMCKICGIDREMLPKLYESSAVVGEILPAIADELGLPRGVKIIAGAGDNAAAAVGTGIVGEGGCNISLGTSGTLFVSSREFRADKEDSLHAFCHADGGWHLMGCILSAAASGSWWMKGILHSTDFAKEESGCERSMGKNEVYFLPYLMGERSSHNDVHARGAFVGMRADTSRKAMTLAVLEGVAFALKDCLEAAKRDGAAITRTSLCGGGAKSRLWRNIIANVMNIPVDLPLTEQGPAFGAAMLAMVGCGEYQDVARAAKYIVKTKETILPDPNIAAAYQERYQTFASLYPSLKTTFRNMK